MILLYLALLLSW